MYIANIEILQDTLIRLQADDAVKSLLLFGGEVNRASPDRLEQALRLNEKPLIGGIFPEIIAEGARRAEGYVIIPLYERLRVGLFASEAQAAPLETQLSTWLQATATSHESVFCFVNALWPHKAACMNALYDELGPFVHYLGGGAGSLSFQSFPCVIANQALAEDAAVVGLMQKPMSIGVAHGWYPITPPIKVTETRGNTVISLNWQPAFEVYQAEVEAHAQETIREENFFEVAKSYPLGLVRLDDEMIVRDPYATEKGWLHIVDAVPAGEYIRIMHGDMDSLLKGAQTAVAAAAKPLQGALTQLCIDCISRVLFMQADFAEELAYLNQNQPANGILSLGEIANPGNAALELFNKTVVVAQWRKEN